MSSLQHPHRVLESFNKTLKCSFDVSLVLSNSLRTEDAFPSVSFEGGCSKGSGLPELITCWELPDNFLEHLPLRQKGPVRMNPSSYLRFQAWII